MTIQIPRIIGHRGAAQAAPENTLESLREAKRQGAAWVEVDAKLTADNQIILLHDDLVDRTTSGKGAAAQMSLAEIRALDAGSWFAPAWKGARVPTLEELVAELAALGLNCNVEIKPCPGREHVTAEFVVRELQRLWPAQAEKPLISSFAYDSLHVANRLAPEFPRAVLVEEVPGNWKDLCEGVNAIALNPWHKTLTPEWTKTIKKAGYQVVSYTVNETARARELFDWGVDGVFSDVPGLLLKDLGE
ncbi:MAG TPA: glycerophosphodiester phosphodiesterase [Dongiaceae bacterium]|jgi:glycerophosphoryl diester phosphodiesterase|nr:glycerophosphodiester phosphodiesterase [Dongiaceae bacterium]